MAGDLNHLSPHADFSYIFFYQFDLPMCRNKQVVIFTPTNENVSFFLRYQMKKSSCSFNMVTLTVNQRCCLIGMLDARMRIHDNIDPN